MATLAANPKRAPGATISNLKTRAWRFSSGRRFRAGAPRFNCKPRLGFCQPKPANGAVVRSSDNLGTVRDLAEYDDATDETTIVDHYVYDAFGNETDHTGSNDFLFKYTGRAFDDETGLQNNLNRWYDPTVGRWLSEDPIGFSAGDANVYRYVGNASTFATDPSGLEPNGDFQWSAGGPGAIPPPHWNPSRSTLDKMDRDFRKTAPGSVDNTTAVTPGVETVRDAYEFGTGKHYRTGEPIQGWGRFWTGAGLFTPFVGGAIYRKFFCGGDEIADAMRHGGDEIADLGDDVGDLNRSLQNSPSGKAAADDMRAGGLIEPNPTHRHHSDPNFMGGKKNQRLTDVEVPRHVQLHKDLNEFLRNRTDRYGNHMCPQAGNSAADIAQNFSRQERLNALAEFYRRYGNNYPDAARDFFKQHPSLQK